jgi:AcrR family transcriptional regulator
MTTQPASRNYSSPLRVEQAEATRSRIVDATVALLQRGDLDFGMQEVADQAGVSVRTVYRAFPTREELISGVVALIKERFEASAGKPPRTPDEFRSSISRSVRAVYELEPLYRAMLATREGRESHRRSAGKRRVHVETAFAEEIEGLTPQHARQFAALMHLVTSSTGVFFMKDYAGLDRDATIGALEWAMTALTAAIRDPELRTQLGQEVEI